MIAPDLKKRISEIVYIPDSITTAQGIKICGRNQLQNYRIYSVLIMAAKYALSTDWRLRRQGLRDTIVELLYGGMPPVPEQTRVELLHPYLAASLGVRTHNAYRILTGPEKKLTFVIKLLAPEGEGPFPVIINGDGGWEFVTEQIIAGGVTARKCALALFSRVEIAADIYQPARDRHLPVISGSPRYFA